MPPGFVRLPIPVSENLDDPQRIDRIALHFRLRDRHPSCAGDRYYANSTIWEDRKIR
jgi:hypothetical protein